MHTNAESFTLQLIYGKKKYNSTIDGLNEVWLEHKNKRFYFVKKKIKIQYKLIKLFYCSFILVKH